jgi:serine/threonine-protein kinase
MLLLLEGARGPAEADRWLVRLGLRRDDLEDETRPVSVVATKLGLDALIEVLAIDDLDALVDVLEPLWLHPEVLGQWGQMLRGVETFDAALLRLGADVEDGQSVRVVRTVRRTGHIVELELTCDHEQALEADGRMQAMRRSEVMALARFFGEVLAAVELGAWRTTAGAASVTLRVTRRPLVPRAIAPLLVGLALLALLVAGALSLRHGDALGRWTTPIVSALLVFAVFLVWLARRVYARMGGAQTPSGAYKIAMLERALLLSQRPRGGHVGDFEGQVVAGRYRIGRRLGTGATGAVYEALRMEDAQPVAIKLLRAGSAHDVASSDRLRREAEALGLSWHPNVVEVYDHGRLPDGTSFLVMERLKGETLADRLHREGCLPEDVALGLAAKVADALVAIHAAGVVHRDLKPDNVFLAGRDEVKLIDFGIARVEWEEMRITGAGTPLGTPGFMAPEQERGEDADAAADWFALGKILYVCATGRSPREPISWDHHEGSANLRQLVADLTMRDASLRPRDVRARLRALRLPETGTL